jgi:hypothetical protein
VAGVEFVDLPILPEAHIHDLIQIAIIHCCYP